MAESSQLTSIIDLHCDTAMPLLAGADLRNTTTQVNLPYMREAGIGLQVFACFVSAAVPADQRMKLALKMITAVRLQVERNSQFMQRVTTAAEAHHTILQNKIAVLLAVENGMVLDNNLTNLEILYDHGVRILTITHAQSSDWAISSTDTKPAFAGLTLFGREVIRTMNEMGMIIDVSHAHDATVDAVLKTTRHPIIASHSCVDAICATPRNLKDRLLLAIAQNGGMFGINFFPGFLDSNYLAVSEQRAGDLFQQMQEMERQAGADPVAIDRSFTQLAIDFSHLMADTPVPAARIIDHLDYVVHLVGEEAVGFGSDFDGVPDLPQGVSDCRGFTLLRELLGQKDYSPVTLAKIFQGNFLRIFDQVCGA